MTFSDFARDNEMMWLSPKLVAKLMQCSLEHVYDLVKSGMIPYIRDGRNIRFRPEDLDAYEKHNYVTRRRNGTVQKKGQ
jgi:excisionase family DNA binding protein